MIAILLRRLLELPVAIVIATSATFALAWIVPGSPMDQPEGRRPPPEIAAAMAGRYELDRPVAFLAGWLDRASGLAWLRGAADRPFDLGPSLRHEGWMVHDIIAAGLPASVAIGAAGLLVALGLGLLVGLPGAARPGGPGDAVGLALVTLAASVPNFVLAAVLLMLVTGAGGTPPLGGAAGTGLAGLLAPACVLALPLAAPVARLARSGALEALAADHALAARGRGVPEWRVVLDHGLRPALLPLLGWLGPAAAVALTGSFVVEKVFAVPGLGIHFVDAVLSRDVTLVMGVVAVLVGLLLAFNAVLDVVAALVDPRVASS